ncbi:hypothetical protein [Inhella sp.]|uniref:hypothetical protein n=1 Tax=Inhella sp. TaxID=1921806 RepID=UPI0035B2D088
MKSWRWAYAMAATLAVLFCAWHEPIQTFATAQVDAGLKRALISFATARGLNGVISVAQGTEFSLEPFGVGVTLTLGQVLDPVNDLVEQFSTLMLWASVSFGIQKAVLALSAHWMVSAAVSGLAIAWFGLQWIDRLPALLTRALLILLLVRFAVPAVTLSSDLVFRHAFAQQYEEQQNAVALATKQVGELSKQQGPKEDASWIERMKAKFSNGLQAANLSYDAIKQSVKDLPERLVKLMVIFLLQTLVLPLVFLWLLISFVLSAPRRTNIWTRTRSANLAALAVDKS